MSLDDAEIFVRHIKTRLGRWPVLYTNGATALHIAENRDRYSLLSRLPLWYARYKPAIGLHFPKGNWQTYTLWQFSAGANCDARSCPYRVPGTPLDIDVNVASMSADELRAAWPFGELADKTAEAVAAAESVPLPISRSAALEGGDVDLAVCEGRGRRRADGRGAACRAAGRGRTGSSAGRRGAGDATRRADGRERRNGAAADLAPRGARRRRRDAPVRGGGDGW